MTSSRSGKAAGSTGSRQPSSGGRRPRHDPVRGIRCRSSLRVQGCTEIGARAEGWARVWPRQLAGDA
jgi:hypothetical protein